MTSRTFTKTRPPRAFDVQTSRFACCDAIMIFNEWVGLFTEGGPHGHH
jgi:hypothetical protein